MKGGASPPVREVAATTTSLRNLHQRMVARCAA